MFYNIGVTENLHKPDVYVLFGNTKDVEMPFWSPAIACMSILQ